jgi:hypothetical protein
MPVNYQYFCETCAHWLLSEDLEGHLENNKNHVVIEKLRYVEDGWGNKITESTIDPPKVPTLSSYSPMKPATNLDKVETTNKWIEALSATFNIPESDWYEVTVSFNWNITSSSKFFEAGLLLDGVADDCLLCIYDKAKYGNIKASTPVTKVGKTYLEKGDHNLSLIFKSSNSKTIASVSRSLISLKRVV